MLSFYLAALQFNDQKDKFEYIYTNYFQFMCNCALTVTQNPAFVEDAVHDTFLQILREIDTIRLDNEKSLRCYLYTITRERSIDFLRKWEKKKESQITASDHLDEEAAVVNPDKIALSRIQLEEALCVLSNMPEVYRRSLILSIQGYSIREIAKITQSSESATKSHIYRARKKY